MSNLFEPKSRKEFLEGVDRGLAQAKSGQRLDAIEAVKDLSKELNAGYQAINAMHTTQTQRMAASS
ncbi:MAG: hypothetical protein IJ682_01945 [Lachnospiraceae bacterium]|nr:hypothetical protein [Lachnospiraceae bacterium]